MRSLLSYWHLSGFMAVFMVFICLVYFYLVGFRIKRQSVYFFIGLTIIILSVASPLYFLGENYLMSAHMTIHVLLLLVAAPLLVLGIPSSVQNKILLRFSEGISKVPWLPWMSGVCIMWFWHIPAIFNLFYNVQHRYFLENIHLVSLVLAGILFSWPLISPFRKYRMPPLNAVLYLSAACIFCSILGLLITFAPVGVYTHYMHIQDRFGFLNLIRNQNGISVLVDQQISGLIMWVPGCLIYLTASMIILMRWFRQKNEQNLLLTNKNGN